MPFGGLADAACRQHALAFDLDHAGAAIAVGAVAGLRRVAQMRDVDAFALGDLPDGLAVMRMHLAPVEREGDAGFAMLVHGMHTPTRHHSWSRRRPHPSVVP